MLSLWLYASVTARHAKLAFILDRYAHILIVVALCGARRPGKPNARADGNFHAEVGPAALASILGRGPAKIRDPLRGWSFEGNALDAYLRHTFVGETTRSHC